MWGKSPSGILSNKNSYSMRNSYFIGRGFSSNINNNNIKSKKITDNKVIKENIISNRRKGKGYISYFYNCVRIGSIHEIIEMENGEGMEFLIKGFTSNILEKLNEDKIYRMLVSLKYEVDGIVKGSSPMRSIMITRSINCKLILERIQQELIRFEDEYELQNYSGDCFVGWKEWLSSEDYAKGLTKKNVDEILTNVLQEEKKSKSKNKYNTISKKMIECKAFEKINKLSPLFDSVNIGNKYKKLSEISMKGIWKRRIKGLNYDSEVLNLDLNWIEIKKYVKEFNNENTYNCMYQNMKFKIRNVYLVKYIDMDTLLFVYEFNDSNKIVRYNCLSDYKSWSVVKDAWNKREFSYTSWMDTLFRNSREKFIRDIEPYKMFIDNKSGKLIYLERYYQFPEIKLPYSDKIYNTKIGSLDLETFIISKDILNKECSKDELKKNKNILDNYYNINVDEFIEEGDGILSVYAGGWKLNNVDDKIKDSDTQMFIIDDKNIHNSNDLIKVMFERLFKNNVNGYTLYVHNLGRFDGIFLIKELAKLDYKISALWNDNAVLKIKVLDKESKQSVTILDSYNLLPQKLKKLLEKFNCKVQKGVFPHLFVNRYNLSYIGEKPEFKFYSYSNISEEEYKNLNNDWNLKEECFKYLMSDVEGLLEVMNKVSEYYFQEYKFNITNILTLPSLSLGIFGIKFFDNEKYNIKMIKGPLEKYIRESYFGGNVGVFANETKGIVGKSYHYDMNSQYPAAMLNKMPIGNPVFSTNSNLDYYSGFVYAEITPPIEERLKNLYIQYRDEKGRVKCPRTSFIRWIDSIELKYAIKDGYTAKIICGITFPDSEKVDSENLFKKYVEHFYDKKLNAKDQIEREIAKLSLNSLYGKFGQKDIESRIKVLDSNEATKLVKKYHYSYLSEIGNRLVIIKYSARLNEKIRRLYKEEEKELDKDFISKKRGIISAVQISSRISALARVSINEYKNMVNNKLFYSDTDSLVLENKLPTKIVGVELGKWKLEGELIKGIFVRPKFYIYEDLNGKIKKVAAGVNANDLNYKDFIDLTNGKEVTTQKSKLIINWKKLEIKTNYQSITLRK